MILLGNWNCMVQSPFLILIKCARDAIAAHKKEKKKENLAQCFKSTSLISARWTGRREEAEDIQSHVFLVPIMRHDEHN